MPLLTLTDVSLAYGDRPLLHKASFRIERGERVCLVGRNGAGKSTLFRVISGLALPDEGEVWRRDTLRISHLLQDIPEDTGKTVFETVAEGLGDLGRLLADYHHAAVAAEAGPAGLHRLDELHQRIDILDGWNVNSRIGTVLSRLELPADKPLAACSGGIRRRVMLAQALAGDPDLLLLDEPTNHMDIASITWLEEFLLAFAGALIFITHDRTLLRRLATRIIELDRGALTSYPGDFDYYLRRKDEMLAAEQRANVKFDKKLDEYEAWIRRGIKARRTRNEGQVRRLEKMRREKRQRLEQPGTASLDLDAGETSGKLVADLRHVTFHYGEQCIVRDFSTRILRGERVGIIGPNGAGKSTLLRLLLGELKPDSGRVVLGERLHVAYFDQSRAQLEPARSVRENISDGGDYVSVKGRSRHVIGYMKDFLFPPQRIDSPVKSLSGGERNRLLLARLFTRPANLLVLDEPTNDLDVETLELLEDLLNDFDGTLLLVSHDRSFLDNVVTSTIAFEGIGLIQEYVGGYQDWLRQGGNAGGWQTPVTEKKPARRNKPKSRGKLSYHKQRELAALPEKIERLEQERQTLEMKISDADFYRQDKETITGTLTALEELRRELEEAYARWEELENFQ